MTCSKCGMQIPVEGQTCSYCKVDKSLDKKVVYLSAFAGGFWGFLIGNPIFGLVGGMVLALISLFAGAYVGVVGVREQSGSGERSGSSNALPSPPISVPQVTDQPAPLTVDQGRSVVKRYEDAKGLRLVLGFVSGSLSCEVAALTVGGYAYSLIAGAIGMGIGIVAGGLIADWNRQSNRKLDQQNSLTPAIPLPQPMIQPAPLTPDQERGLLASGQYKKCDHCAEIIRADAKLCRFCGYDVAPAEVRDRRYKPGERRLREEVR